MTNSLENNEHMRSAMWVGPKDKLLNLKKKIEDHLQNAFSEASERYEWEWVSFEKPEEAELFLEKSATPALNLLDHASSKNAANEDWKRLCLGIKKLEPKACILAISDKALPSGDESISILDQGCDGLFNIESKNEDSKALLRELLSLPLKLLRSRHARVAAKHKITVRLSSFTQAIATETLNIGTGGLFIRHIPPNIAVGDHVEFVLHFTSQVSDTGDDEDKPELIKKINEAQATSITTQSSDLSGEGKVVWVRPTARENLPEGIGVEFVHLSEESNEKIQEFVARRRVKAFIPKS